MQDHRNETRNGNSVAPPDRRAHAVVLYDNLLVGRQAVKLAARILEQVEGERGFACSLWPEHALRVPAVHAHVGREAAEADLVVIAARQPVLSETVRNWIVSWAEQAVEGLALAFLFDEFHEEPTSCGELQTELENLAAWQKVGVFVNAVEISGTEENCPDRVPVSNALEVAREALAGRCAGELRARASHNPGRGVNG